MPIRTKQPVTVLAKKGMWHQRSSLCLDNRTRFSSSGKETGCDFGGISSFLWETKNSIHCKTIRKTDIKFLKLIQTVRDQLSRRNKGPEKNYSCVHIHKPWLTLHPSREAAGQFEVICSQFLSARPRENVQGMQPGARGRKMNAEFRILNQAKDATPTPTLSFSFSNSLWQLISVVNLTHLGKGTQMWKTVLIRMVWDMSMGPGHCEQCQPRAGGSGFYEKVGWARARLSKA